MSPADREAVPRVYTNLGKSIAACEFHPGASRFDTYVEAVLKNEYASANQTLNKDE